MQYSIETQPNIHELQVAKLHEAITAADHVTVEFGTGNLPLFESQDAHTFNAQNLYIGVNLDSKQHKHLAEKVEDIHGFAVLSEKNEKGDIGPLPIGDGSVDTVFMANVFGEPDSEHIMESFKYPDRLYRGNSSVDSKIETLTESMRILKEGGKIVVLENNTPYQGSISGKYNSMVRLLEESGFQSIQGINRTDDDWEELVSQFAKPGERWSYSSYLVVAEKPTA